MLNRFSQARAIEKWAAKIIVDGTGWQKETFAFEYVSIERSSWASTGWRQGVVTSHVRRGMNEGYVLEIRVDGNIIIASDLPRGGFSGRAAGGCRVIIAARPMGYLRERAGLLLELANRAGDRLIEYA